MPEKSKKPIQHMGMDMTNAEHDIWHAQHQEMTEEEHGAMLDKLGISIEEDKAWHAEQDRKIPEKTYQGLKAINPFAVGGGFLDHCIAKGWVVKDGSGRQARYFVTDEGVAALRKFNIKL